MKKIARATIKDIARAAGVTPTTVSYILNDKPFSFKEETKEKVRKVAMELGYTVNGLAKGLVTGRTNTIGVEFSSFNIEDAFANMFFIDLISSLCSEISRNGFNIYFSSSHKDKNNNDMGQNLKEVFDSGRVDGVVIIGPVKMNANEFDELRKYRIPSVLTGRINGLNEFNMVDVDNDELGYMAVDHLFKTDRKNLCVVGSIMDYTYAYDRLNGAKRAFNEHGKKFLERNLINVGFDLENVCNTFSDTIKKHGEIDGVFALTALHALGVKKAVEESGLRIPEDIGLITVGDPTLNNISGLPLTTVDINAKKIGKAAARMLIEKINTVSTRSYTQEFLSPELIVRKST